MTRTHMVSKEIELTKGTCPMPVGRVETLRRHVICFYGHLGLGALSVLPMGRGVGLKRIGVLAVVMLLAVTGSLHAEPIAGKPPLTVIGYGAAYTKSLMLAFVFPYRQMKSRWVNVDDYNGGLARIRAQVRSLNVKWDVVTMNIADTIQGCREGLFEKIDHSVFGKSAIEDFYPTALQECGIGQNIDAMVIAYNPGQFSASKPSTLGDFFDVKRFPGARGMWNSPMGNLEWALMADGVPSDQIYQVLSTDSGLDRAFKSLDRIKENIVWWDEHSQPIALLLNREVVMTAAPSGRIFDAIKERNARFAIIWDGQIWNMEFWVIPKGTANLREGLDFIVFASDPKRMAVQANHIAYAPARKSAMAFVDNSVRKYLPTAKENGGNALRIGYKWWANHYPEMEARFVRWKEKKTWRYDFQPPDAH